LIVVNREAVQRLLSFESCVPLMRAAMVALSRGETRQALRQIIPLDAGHMLGLMLGAMGGSAEFGAKVISVFPEHGASGGQKHQGGILLFEPVNGRPVALLNAGEITHIRTAAASAAATDALATPGASRLAVLGYGQQAEAHVRAMTIVRPLTMIKVWGRDQRRRSAFAERLTAEGIPCQAADSVLEAVEDVDIICTTTSAQEPFLHSRDVSAGTHINLVGSSYLGPSEVDIRLVARARFFGDHRAGILAQGAEFAYARQAGLIDDTHFLGEIGQVLVGDIAGRLSCDDVTVYKSLGHIVQDIAAAWHVFERAREEGFPELSF
jgi:ornithine cyclodeaminase/alanine dehydrogenase-like protein (mu-crystallin family)